MKKNLDELKIILYYQSIIIIKKKEGGKNEQKQNHISCWSRVSHRIDS